MRFLDARSNARRPHFKCGLPRLSCNYVLDQPALLGRRFDEALEQRMRLKRARLQFRVVLDADEPGMIRVFDGLGQHTIRRHAGEDQTAVFQTVLVVDIDFVAVAVALGDVGRAVDLGDLGVLLDKRRWRRRENLGMGGRRIAGCRRLYCLEKCCALAL